MQLNIVYMFICKEMIEETGRPPGLIFGSVGIILTWLVLFRVLENLHVFLEL